MDILAEILEALKSNDEEARRSALQKLRGHHLSDIRDLIFAAMADESWRIRKEAVDIFVSACPDDRIIRELLELLRNEENAGLRNSAAEAVARLGSIAAGPLYSLSCDADADVRKAVLDVMGTIGTPEFLPSLRGALSDSNVNVAAAAAEHLGNLGDNATVTDLIDAIIANQSDFFRFSALAALGKMSSHVHVPEEIIALADRDILRKGVYDCLGSIGDETSAHILLDGFNSHQKSSRKAAVVSWYRIFLRSRATARRDMEDSLRSLSDGELLPVLIKLFKAGDNFTDEAVISMLGIIGDLRGIDTLLHAYADERNCGVALTALKRIGLNGLNVLFELYPQGDEDVRSSICAVLGELGYRDGASIIRKGLKDCSASVRKFAVLSAGRLGLAACIDDVSILLNDIDPEVKTAATNCLQLFVIIDRSKIQEVAVKLAESNSAEQRKNASILFAALGNGERLSMLVKDENAEVRQTAVASIGKLVDFSDAGILLIALVDEDPDVRIAAVETLGRIGDGSVLDALIHALNDEDIWVKSAVLRSIYKIDRQALFPAIASLFAQADGLLMITCLELLESLGSKEAMELVESALEIEDTDILGQVVAILSRQGGEWVMTNMERFLSSPRSEVRLAWIKLMYDFPGSHDVSCLIQAFNREQDETVKAELKFLLDEIK